MSRSAALDVHCDSGGISVRSKRSPRMECRLCIDRLDQCVALRGLDSNVSTITRSTSASLTVRCRPAGLVVKTVDTVGDRRRSNSRPAVRGQGSRRGRSELGPPPERALVLCVDEKSQIQALNRTAPLLPIRFGEAERRTHDYVHHGTTTLFAALEVATGRITADACLPRHRNGEFLAFLKMVAKAHPPRVQLHVVCDELRHPQPPDRQGVVGEEPARITMHFTPTSASWMNMVEIFFGIITRQAIRRSTFTSVPDLIGAIRTFIDAYNERCKPFKWTKTADQILAKEDRQTISGTEH
jgi:transposase